MSDSEDRTGAGTVIAFTAACLILAAFAAFGCEDARTARQAYHDLRDSLEMAGAVPALPETPGTMTARWLDAYGIKYVIVTESGARIVPNWTRRNSGDRDVDRSARR